MHSCVCHSVYPPSTPPSLIPRMCPSTCAYLGLSTLNGQVQYFPNNENELSPGLGSWETFADNRCLQKMLGQQAALTPCDPTGFVQSRATGNELTSSMAPCVWGVCDTERGRERAPPSVRTSCRQDGSSHKQTGSEGLAGAGTCGGQVRRYGWYVR